MSISLVSIFILQICIIMAIKGQRFTDHPLGKDISILNANVGYRDRRNKAEPTCEELRAMWRYSKRQNRAAEITNDLPMYRDPFSYNIWETYPIRSQSNIAYREEREEEARNRGGGRVPVYGKMVHKAPAESKFRSGLTNRMKAFEEVAQLYGTINRQPPEYIRRPLYNFRVGGRYPNVPQAGSFQHLKELIKTERARELQDQRLAEEMAARASTINDLNNKDNNQHKMRDRRNYFNSLEPYQNYKNHYSNFIDNFMKNDDYNSISI